MRPRGAVIIGGYINGLGLARSLAARGVRVGVIRTNPFDIAHRSICVSSHDVAGGLAGDPDRLVETLERRAAEWRGWALIPADDAALDAIARHWDWLAARHLIVAPTPEQVPFFLDKEKMLAAARSIGMDLPRLYGVAGVGAPLDPEPRFPLLVKPFTGHHFSTRFGVKMFTAHGPDEFKSSVELAAGAGLRCGVFEFIPGPDSQIYAYCTYIDRRGAAAPGVTIRKLRQSPPLAGVARVAEIVPEPPGLREAVLQLLRKIGFRGMAAAEFKLDPRDGSFKFLEVNGRSVIYNALLRKGGLDLAALAWSDYVEVATPEMRPANWPGIWVNLHADLLYSAFHGRSEGLTLRSFLRPYRRPKIEAVWSPQDPAPFFSQWGGTALRSFSAIWRGQGSNGRKTGCGRPPAEAI